MSSKLVVPADIFNSFETERFSKLHTKRRDSSSSENSTKSDQNKKNLTEDTAVPPVLHVDEKTTKNSRNTLNILTKTNSNSHLSSDLKAENTDISDKIESGDMNCSNKDNNEIKKRNNVVECEVNGEPPAAANVPSMTGQAETSTVQSVEAEGAANLDTKNILTKNPVFLIKNASGKTVPFIFKNSILLKNRENVEQNVFANNNGKFVTIPNKLISNGNVINAAKPSDLNKFKISTPILFFTPNSETSTENTKISTENTQISTQNSEISTKNSEISTEHSKTKIEISTLSTEKSTQSEKSTEPQKPAQSIENPTKISPKKSTQPIKISTEKSTVKKPTRRSKKFDVGPKKPGSGSAKLVIDRKLVTVSTASISTKSTTTTTTSNSDFVSTFEDFILKTSYGKQVIIPGKKFVKILPKVDILEKKPEEPPKTVPENVRILEPSKLSTKSIIINNQVVPVSINTKFAVDNGSNTQPVVGYNNEAVLNIITQKSVEKVDTNVKPKVDTKQKVDTKPKVDTNKKVDNTKAKLKSPPDENAKRKQIQLKKAKNPVKTSEEKVYQIQVEKEEKTKLIFPSEQIKNINKKCENSKSDVDLLSGCVQLPMCVENWTQTDVSRQDAACQTDVYVAPTPVAEFAEEECPNIPELIDYLLSTPKYSIGMDELTKTDIIINSQKFKPAETALTAPPAPKAALTLKERLFFELRDCTGFDFLGNMPIHNAVLDNNVNDLRRQVYVLRLRRFSIDFENNFNQTALQLSIINNKNQDIITTLLASGANVFVKDNLGNTLLHLAVLNTDHHILELLLGYFNGDTTCINTKNDEGLTPLMVAAIECKPESVAVLLKFGADPNLRDDKSGRTALFHAVELNNIPVITCLLQNKADPKVRNFFGLTAIDAVKDLNTPIANLIEKQVTRCNPLAAAEPTVSPKKRAVKRPRQTDGKCKNKMAAASKTTKVEAQPTSNNVLITKQEKVSITKQEKVSINNTDKIKSPQVDGSAPTIQKTNDS